MAKSSITGKRRIDDNDDYVPVGKGGKAKYTFGGMAKNLAKTTRIEEVVQDTTNIAKNTADDADKASDTSSDLRLSYLDDVPLKTRFPDLKPPTSTSTIRPSIKPLTITLPASSTHKPLRSVTDILRELNASKAPTDTVPPPSTIPPARFGGGEVAYTSSAIQAEARAFASALADSNLPSQPSPTDPSSINPLPDTTPALDASAIAVTSQPSTNLHD
ncbi:hypothetical protein AX14_008661 [Amanita brunnescens Koide BX004]|nr:hypothetical protein AX14_008661 [Amanita brunnescens Koide BX004]